jgi:hypothetical protein
MVRLGEVKTFNSRITFKDWCKKHLRPGRFTVLAIFPPNRYPSFSIVFEDAVNNLDVRLTVSSDVFKKAMQSLGIKLSRNDLPTLDLVIENNLSYGLAIKEEADHVLEWNGNFWKRQKISQEEDLPVEF